MNRNFLLAAVLLLSACGQDRYIAMNGSAENRWSDMMACRHGEWVERGGPVRAFAMGIGGAIGGAAGGALIGGASASTNPVKYSDAVDRCMAERGYVATAPNPWDH